MRVQQHETNGRLVFEVEGALSGPALAELERCWRNTPTVETRTAIIDLSGVTQVDDLGRTLLQRMHLQGASFSGAKLRIKDILDELINETPLQEDIDAVRPNPRSREVDRKR